MDIAFDPRFIPSVNALAPVDVRRVWKAVETFQRDPDHSGLNFERMKGKAGRQRLHTIRASRPVRVLLAREGQTAVFLRAGPHEFIDNLVASVAFTVPDSGAPRLIPIRSHTVDFDESELSGVTAWRAGEAAIGRSILEHWTNRELADAGFDKEEISRLRRTTEETLTALWSGADDEKLELIFECWEQSPAARRSRRDNGNEHERFRDAIVGRGALAGLSALLSPEQFRRLRAAPIEEWMIFLHPAQRALVDRRFDGPAFVRGAAGTGKTVVALHRAAVLAKRLNGPRGWEGRKSRPVLFTTFIESLPPVFENLYRRLPTAVDEAVDFISVDKLARRVCEEDDKPARLNRAATDRAFERACDSVVRNDSPLARSGVSRAYLRDEVTRVLKGRGIGSLDAYLAAEVTDRRVPFSEAMREQTWELLAEWDRRLAQAGIEDFADVVRRARDIVRARRKPTYEAAIVDESQDLTLVSLELVRALVNGTSTGDRPDALFLVGDGAQKLYPGGFTLSEAGLDVRGNSVALRVNYRNPPEIIRAAMACAGSERVDDHGKVYRRGDVPPKTVRRASAKPSLVRVGNVDAQISHVVEEIRRLRCQDADLGLGDIGVFAPSNDLVDRAISCFADAELACQPLTKYEGQSNAAIKVGTFNRVKGLEFKVVFLLDLSVFPRRRRPAKAAAENEERLALHVSQLFVAMTRARDGLFLLCGDGPSDVIAKALKHFEDTDGSRPGG